MNNDIKVVIGSWGSYNFCNERALGSNWLTLNDYTDWDDIEKELIKEGFDLEGIDAELFIQDIEGLDANVNWDYVNPKKLFETLYYSDVFVDDYKFKIMEAFIEVRTLGEFMDLVDKYESSWTDDICLYEGYDWDDYGRMIFERSETVLPSELEEFFDYEGYGESVGDSADKYSGGIIEIFC